MVSPSIVNFLTFLVKYSVGSVFLTHVAFFTWSAEK